MLHEVEFAAGALAEPEFAVLGCSPVILWSGARFVGGEIVKQIGATIRLIVESRSAVLGLLLTPVSIAVQIYLAAALPCRKGSWQSNVMLQNQQIYHRIN